MTKFTYAVSLAVALVAGSVGVGAEAAADLHQPHDAGWQAGGGSQAGDVSITENDVNCKVVKVEAVDWPTSSGAGRQRLPNTTPINRSDGLKALFE
jgi:hypothetical protein